MFIGWGATILGGSHIGDNVIIGANSVVSGNVDSNSVYAGNPARKLMTLEEYRDKREKLQLNEAVEYVLEYEKSLEKLNSKKYQFNSYNEFLKFRDRISKENSI